MKLINNLINKGLLLLILLLINAGNKINGFATSYLTDGNYSDISELNNNNSGLIITYNLNDNYLPMRGKQFYHRPIYRKYYKSGKHHNYPAELN